MANTKKEPVYFTKILGIENDLAVMLSHFKKHRSNPSVTRIFFIDRGEWFWLTDIDEAAYGLALIPEKGKRPRATLALGRTGTFISSPRGKSPVESSLPDSDAFWTDLAAGPDAAYACGTQGAFAVYAKSRWKIFSKSPIKTDWAAVTISDDGTAYVGGERGALWSWNGKKWADVSIATTLSLNAVAASKKRLVVGSDGYVFIREGKKPWIEIKLPTKETVESVLNTSLGIFVLTQSTLFELKNNTSSVVFTAKQFKIQFADCDFVEGVLWLTGDGLVISWDGKQTKTYTCPENERPKEKRK